MQKVLGFDGVALDIETLHVNIAVHFVILFVACNKFLGYSVYPRSWCSLFKYKNTTNIMWSLQCTYFEEKLQIFIDKNCKKITNTLCATYDYAMHLANLKFSSALTSKSYKTRMWKMGSSNDKRKNPDA